MLCVNIVSNPLYYPQNSAGISYNAWRTQSKIIITIALAAISLLVFGAGLISYSFHTTPWVSVSLMGVGAAGFIVSVGVAWKVFRRVGESSERIDSDIQTPSNPVILSKRNVPSVSDIIVDPTLPQYVLPNEILELIFFNLMHPADLACASLVCRQWYLVVNNEHSPIKKILDDAFGRGFPLHKQVDKQISQMFSLHDLLEKTPTITEDFKLNVDPDSSLLEYFEKTNSPVLKGQDSSGKWFFAIRCKWNLDETVYRIRKEYDPSQSADGDAIIFIYKNKQEEWIARGTSFHRTSTKVLPREGILPRGGILLGHPLLYAADIYPKSVLEWMKCLLDGRSCGPLIYSSGGGLWELTQDMHSLTLWRSED